MYKSGLHKVWGEDVDQKSFRRKTGLKDVDRPENVAGQMPSSVVRHENSSLSSLPKMVSWLGDVGFYGFYWIACVTCVCNSRRLTRDATAVEPTRCCIFPSAALRSGVVKVCEVCRGFGVASLECFQAKLPFSYLHNFPSIFVLLRSSCG